MSNKNLRVVIRFIHLLAAVSLGLYFYSPLVGDPTLALIVRFVTLPGILLTGIALWQQSYLNKLLNSIKRRQTTHE